MAIIRAIVDGERDPRTLAQMRDRRCKKSEKQITEELTGNWRPEHLFNLRQALKMYDQLCTVVADYDSEIRPYLTLQSISQILDAGNANEKSHTYRLAGPTCLAGDVIGDYSFDRSLQAGDKLVFTDMAHYTMVKNTMFNGVNLPDIVLYDPKQDAYHVQRCFTYEDFKGRLS